MEDKDKIIVALKAENKRLRQELTTYGATGICEVCSDKANKLADKYFGCLQEIKEIAEFHITQADNEDVQNDMKQIIDLITKMEEE